MSLVGALRSAVQAMSVTQASFQVASTNIANVNTEGYSRKTADVSTLVVDGLAAGLRLTDIQRQVDSALIRRVREEAMTVGRLEVRNAFLERMQQFFGTLGDNSSLSHLVSRLAGALEGMATRPDSATSGIDVVDSAIALASQLNTTTEELQRMRLEADQEIARVVDPINAALGDIDELNTHIVRALNIGEPTGELMDQRDRLIAELAKEIDLRVMERGDGQVAIYTLGGRALLDGEVNLLAHAPATQVGPTVGYGNGIGGILLGVAATDITLEIQDGRLAALVELRDRLAVDLQAEIDRLAETLRAQVNALHNNGSAYPAPTSMTGTQTVAGTDRPAMTGTFRVTVMDSAGVVVETLDINLATLAPPSIGQLVTAIDGMANATASITAAGKVTIAATGGRGITVNEMTSAVTSGAATTGMAQFLGLNDFFTGADDYATYLGDRVVSDTAALGLAGNLTFRHAGTTTVVAYAAGDSLNAIATAITAALAAQNIDATVVRDGSGFRLQIDDADADNFFVSDSGSLSANLNLRPGQAGAAGILDVRDLLRSFPELVARGQSSGAAGLAVGAIALSLGDGTTARAIADLFTTQINIARAGGLPATLARLSDYAGTIVSANALVAANAKDEFETGESRLLSVTSQAAAVSQVNIDEEMANIIVLQNAYGAAARVTSTASDMLDVLLSIGN